jgi:hypothetical protein
LVVYQIMMLVAPHLLPPMKVATEQMAMQYLEDTLKSKAPHPSPLPEGALGDIRADVKTKR